MHAFYVRMYVCTSTHTTKISWQERLREAESSQQAATEAPTEAGTATEQWLFTLDLCALLSPAAVRTVVGVYEGRA